MAILRSVGRRLRGAALSAVRLEARYINQRGTDRLLRLLYHPDRRETDYASFVGNFGGMLFQIDTRSFIEWSVYVYGGYQRESVDLLRRLARPGATVLDVGANVGTFTLPLANAVGAAGSVHAFEPHPQLRERLRTNAALNNLRHVTVSGLALGAVPGETTLFGSADANQGAGSLRPPNGASESFICRVETMDRYVAHAGLARVDLVKIDVEGAELEVLRGARAVLEAHKPCIYLETNPSQLTRFGASVDDLRRFVRERGYSIWRDATSRYGLPRLTLMGDDAVVDESTHGNWLAVHPGAVAEVVFP